MRSRIQGTLERPRVSVHRTNKHMYAQMIDDETGHTICAASSLSLHMGYGGNVEAAKAVGEALGKRAVELKITHVGFDRGSRGYHGRVKALAEAMRASGVKF